MRRHSGGGFASVLGGAALLLLAAFAPWSLFRLLPFLEAGAVGHLEGLSQRARHQAAVPVRGLANVALRAAMAGSMAGSWPPEAVGVIGSGGRRAGIGEAGPAAARDPAAPIRPAVPVAAAPAVAAPPAGAAPMTSVDPYSRTDWAGPQPWDPGARSG